MIRCEAPENTSKGRRCPRLHHRSCSKRQQLRCDGWPLLNMTAGNAGRWFTSNSCVLIDSVRVIGDLSSGEVAHGRREPVGEKFSIADVPLSATAVLHWLSRIAVHADSPAGNSIRVAVCDSHFEARILMRPIVRLGTRPNSCAV